MSTLPESTMASSETPMVSEKGFVPALLLCFFLGGLGIHRFYVGKIGTGILMILTLGGLGIWAIVDFVMIAVGSFKDKDGLDLKR
jgi:TM2 domain-containing membrane protein YozV